MGSLNVFRLTALSPVLFRFYNKKRATNIIISLFLLNKALVDDIALSWTALLSL
ncbi:hypothetical protein [Proteus sp. FME41]|uniref:hypothetical protein n=1 Tax=Proteus sp. FME41 TaxID=2742608 RepID=UPI0018678F0E|nr:hypothetical protein [Proteus sp. FME41]